MAAVRTPKAGEDWIYQSCEVHQHLSDVVLICRSFEDQPDRMKQYLLGLIYCGCFYPVDQLRWPKG